MKYAFSCPPPCNHTISVEAKGDEEAIDKIVAAGKVHAKEAHPDMPPMTEQETKQMVRTGMKKG